MFDTPSTIGLGYIGLPTLSASRSRQAIDVAVVASKHAPLAKPRTVLAGRERLIDAVGLQA